MRCGRAIRVLLAFALFGALATVHSSWAIHALVAWRGPSQQESGYWHEDGAFPAFARLEWPGDRVHTDRSRASPIVNIDSAFIGTAASIGWSRRTQWVCVGRGGPGQVVHSNDHLSVTLVGFPRPALRVASFQTSLSANASDRVASPIVSWRHGLQLADAPPDNKYILDRFALPLLPLWPGFLINTFLYALLLFLAWRLPGVLRRTLRRRRGRCAQCGYDRGGLDARAACPECGVGGV